MKIVAALLIVIGVGAIAINAALRRHKAEPAADSVYILPPHTDRFEVTLTEANLSSVLAEAEAAVAAGLRNLRSELPEVELSEEQAAALASATSERLAATLLPEPGRWGSLVRASGFDDDAVAALLDRASDRWEVWQHCWGSAPMSLDRVHVRPLLLDSPQDAVAQIGRSMTRSPIRPAYPSQPAGAAVYEVLIPVHMREIQSSARRPVHLGFSYFWSQERREWILRNVSVYSDQGNIAAPPQ
jgi:hypothetical protein